MNEKIKHLELIQSVVSRFNTNSFHLKGWSVLLVSALFALSGSDSNILFVFVAYLPALVFWCLDGYFLSQERLFRKLYDIVRQKDNKEVDFSMSVKGLNEKKYPWASSMKSITLWPFYTSILASILIVTMIHKST